MTEDTLRNDCINEILDNVISITLKKRTILSGKSNNDDVPDKDSENVSNSYTDILKSMMISAIETK